MIAIRKFRGSRSWSTLCAAILVTAVWAGHTSAQTAKTTKYTYDALGRLTYVEDSQNGNRDYDYDAAGNRRNVAVGTGTDAASEPAALPTPPAPAGLASSFVSNSSSCKWSSSWGAVSGATSYRFRDTYNPVATLTVTSKTVTCPVGSPQGIKPLSVQACNASGCSMQSYF